MTTDSILFYTAHTKERKPFPQRIAPSGNQY